MNKFSKNMLFVSSLLVIGAGQVKADGCSDVTVLDAKVNLVRALGDQNSIRQANEILAGARSDLIASWEPLFAGLSEQDSLKGYFTGADASARKADFVDKFMNKCRANPLMGTKNALYSVVGDLVVSAKR